MEVHLVNNVLKEIQRRSEKAARDSLYQYHKYLEHLYCKIERLRYLEYESDVHELNRIIKLLCASAELHHTQPCQDGSYIEME